MSVIEQTPSAEATGRSAEVKVWDILVRLFHWSLVVTFALAWISAEEWDKIHENSGYIVGGLVAFRVIWGLIGTKHARFMDFVKKPSIVYSYMLDGLQHRAKRYIGHNPAGGAMVIALLIAIAVITATGIAMTSDMFWGVEWVGEVHEAAANATLLLILLHVAGVIFASREHHENLVKSMITGWKRR